MQGKISKLQYKEVIYVLKCRGERVMLSIIHLQHWWEMLDQLKRKSHRRIFQQKLPLDLPEI